MRFGIALLLKQTAPFEINSSRVEIISATPLQRSAPVTAAKEFSEKQSTEQDQKSSLRTGFAVIGGLILAAILAVAIFAVAKNDGNSTNSKPASPSATPTATPSATPSTVVTPSASPSPSATSSASPTPLPTSTVIPSATDLPPIGVNAFFNSTGATIFWRADPNASGISGYIIEASLNGGHFKLIDTLPASHHSHDVIETDSDGWTSFKVSAVYSDGAIVAGKLFGLAGTY